MPQSLPMIPAGVPIVEEDGSITTFFRLRWEDLITSFTLTPTAAAVLKSAQSAAIATTAVLTTTTAGRYRISYYMRKTTADGVSSSLTMTLGWTETGIPLTKAGAALALDTTSAYQDGSVVVTADQATDLTYAVAYASNTPGTMVFRVDVLVERLA